MRRPPAFWHSNHGGLPTLLAPAAAVAAFATAWNMRRPGWRAPVPVVCVGNATLGGAGKTTVALDLLARIRQHRPATHVLLRGYGGTARGPDWVRPDEPAARVGDEALLFAPRAPTWIGGNRAQSAEAAVAAGADALLMDDGLQNPSLAKDLSLLVIDGASGFGNGRVFPAGPLREAVTSAARRCQAAVLISADRMGSLSLLPPRFPVLGASLVPGAKTRALAGQRVLAFTGIALPEKFFATLSAVGAEIVGRRAFPDHHLFRSAERDALESEARRRDAQLVTTAKDAVRLPATFRSRVHVADVSLMWDDTDSLDRILARVLGSGCSPGPIAQLGAA